MKQGYQHNSEIPVKVSPPASNRIHAVFTARSHGLDTHTGMLWARLTGKRRMTTMNYYLQPIIFKMSLMKILCPDFWRIDDGTR